MVCEHHRIQPPTGHCEECILEVAARNLDLPSLYRPHPLGVECSICECVGDIAMTMAHSTDCWLGIALEYARR